VPLKALQLDRALVASAPLEPTARRACRAVAALAQAYGVPSIASGIDTEAVYACMVDIGVTQGTGAYLDRAQPLIRTGTSGI
jgi:EAL domain-containing protein (putative c-di-GMP-specific phosphodiesterase class I)